MNVDITSMFFNSKIEGQTATPAWGTSIGQSKSEECRVDTHVPGVVDFLIGMTYKAKSDLSLLDASKGSDSREILSCAVFDKVYINEVLLPNAQYIVVVVREHSKSHPNRLLISYAPYLSYDGRKNEETIALMRQSLECSEQGCWFVYDISIINQDEIHFSAIVVDPSRPAIYTNANSQKRSKDWNDLVTEHSTISVTHGETHVNIKEEFRYFLANCTRSARKSAEQISFSVSAQSSYLVYLEPTKLFDYAPDKWSHIKSIYSVINSADAFQLYKTLMADKDFVNRDTTDANQYRSGALSLYVCFLKAREYFANQNNNNQNTKQAETYSFTPASYDKYLRAIRTKPFLLLAGISGTGKSRIVRELAFRSCPEYLQDKDKTTPGNYCMIEVKPNWHDSSEIIGYYSNINKQYQFSRFVKFLVKAMMFPKVPFFVCLDEMNLAPVEQYFAEFLSILETRKKSGDHIQTGVLVEGRYFHEIGVTGCKNNGEVYMKLHETNLDYVDADCATATSLIENGLTLPDNVFVIGTVNMDDTTHQFSRKVIDRAMTIEMNGGKLSEMFGHSSDLEYLPEEQVWKLDIFQPKHVNADEVVANNPDATQIITEELPKQLDAINDVLRDTPFQVSYRVLNEMVIYFSVLVESGMPSEEAKNLAVDQMLLMKILPRIEGDRDMLMLDAQTCRLDKLEPFAASEDTKKKIAEMKNRLNKQEFTRFWP